MIPSNYMQMHAWIVVSGQISGRVSMHSSKESLQNDSAPTSVEAVAMHNLPQTLRGRERSKSRLGF